MDRNKIIDFLIKAKKRTYAGKGKEKSSSRPASHDLEYIEDDLRYIDTYLGSYKFAGEEAVWEKDIPIWAMNYCGRVLSDKFEFDFLKEALLNVQMDLPYRGPREFRKNNFEYKCIIKGDFYFFYGNEEIYKNDTKVYECRFHGGEII